MRRLQGFCLLRFTLLLLLAAGPAAAAAPEMLLDINPGGIDQDSDAGVIGSFLPIGRVALVPISEESSGDRLWVTDGTDAGTRPLPGTAAPVAAVGNVGLFPVFENGLRSVWRTDGTRSGTFPLVSGKATCRQMTAPLGRELLLTLSESRDEFDPCELWKTDGTVAGTVRVSGVDLREAVALVSTGDRAFFSRPGPEGGELWGSDGTPEGTVRLRRWPSAVPVQLIAVGRRLFFVAPEDGLELWTSDGTPGGTRPVTHFAPADPFVLRSGSVGGYVAQALDGRLAFLANDGTAGRELWISDGTAAGTRPATAFPVASPFLGLDTWRVETLAGRLVFPANDGTSGNRLWTSTGKPASTAPISGCTNGCPELAPGAEMVRQGAHLAFVGARDESELWVTDGTGRGTRRLIRSPTNWEEGVSHLNALLGRVFFAVEAESGDRSLYATDETLSSAVRLASLDSTALPIRPVALGGIALFALPKYYSRFELWRSDGTPEGTFPVTRIGQTGESSEPGQLVPAGDAVRFLAIENEEGGGIWTSHGTAGTTTVLREPVRYADRLVPLGPLTLLDTSGGLWKTDGTEAGTVRLASSGDGEVLEIAPLTTGRAVFAMRSFDDWSLWATDGSPVGTQKITDLPGGAWQFRRYGPAGREAFFTVDSSAGAQLWVSDGTAAGTRQMTGGFPDSIETPLQAVRLGSAVFFAGDDDHVGDEVWRSDGTAAGTFPLAEGRAAQPGSLLEHRGALYFFAGNLETPADDIGLWRSDGTEAGTVVLHSWSRESFPFLRELVPFGDLLVFGASDEGGVELWRTDGTAAGTIRVRDVNPGTASSYPYDFAVLGNRLYFSAQDRPHGTELWESDGTSAGTRLVQDIAPQSESSGPQELTAAGGRLYFTADDGVHGREPWVYSPGAPGDAACIPSDTALCLRGGRFKVEADWRDFEGHSGRGHAVTRTADTGTFWFFDPANVEVILKVLDGQDLNGHFWVFYGALSNVEYSLTVTDVVTGAARRYTNISGQLGSVADTEAFGPNGAEMAGAPQTSGEAIVSTRSTAATGACTPSATRLCLQDGRFAVEASWKTPGQAGTGQAVPLAGGDTGYFWFFDAANVEVVLKVLDGRPLNGKFWVFYGALSDVEYTLTVTDTETGAVKTYTNPSGRLASVADTGAF